MARVVSRIEIIATIAHVEVMPYWTRPFECGVVRKATATRPKKQAECSCRSVCDVCSVFGFVSQLLFITGKHTGLPVTWMEVVQPCIKAVSCLPLYSESCGVSESMSGCPKSACFEALSLEAGKDLSVVEDAFEQEKEALAKLTAQRRAERAVR